MKARPRSLSPGSASLLEEVLRSRAANLQATVGGQRRLDLPLTLLKQIEALVAAEFSATGLNENSEPNARGLRLEELLNEILTWIWYKQETPGESP